MTMKQNLTLFLFVLSICIANGQVIPTECLKKQTSVDSLLLANNFQQAEELWKDIQKKCDKPTQEFYTLGETILRHNIEMASISDKPEVINNLVALYDEYDKKYPSNKNGNNIRKAIIYHNNQMSSRDEIYRLLDQAFKQNRSQFTDAEALYLYFDVYNERYLKGEQKITFDEFFTQFIQLESHVNLLTVDASPQQLSIYKNLSQSLDGLIAPTANCTQLSDYYRQHLDDKKADATWLTNAGNRLLKADCTIEPVFMKIAEAAHNLAPSASSAYNLAIAHFRDRNNEKASQYFEQAANLNTNPTEKAEIYYALASTIYMSTNKAKAKESLMKATKASPTFGKPYLLLAQMYGASGTECGANSFESKAVNWLAAETALKASSVEARYKVGAENMAERYRKNAPTKADIKEAKMAGKTIAFKCWINESVTVPKI